MDLWLCFARNWVAFALSCIRLAKVVNVLAIRQVKQGTETTGSVKALLCTRVNMLALDLIFTESSICLRIQYSLLAAYQIY